MILSYAVAEGDRRTTRCDDGLALLALAGRSRHTWRIVARECLIVLDEIVHHRIQILHSATTSALPLQLPRELKQPPQQQQLRQEDKQEEDDDEEEDEEGDSSRALYEAMSSGLLPGLRIKFGPNLKARTNASASLPAMCALCVRRRNGTRIASERCEKRREVVAAQRA
jgi:hypothetical protein